MPGVFQKGILMDTRLFLQQCNEKVTNFFLTRELLLRQQWIAKKLKTKGCPDLSGTRSLQAMSDSGCRLFSGQRIGRTALACRRSKYINLPLPGSFFDLMLFVSMIDHRRNEHERRGLNHEAEQNNEAETAGCH
jgi:hypothetical protein